MTAVPTMDRPVLSSTSVDDGLTLVLDGEPFATATPPCVTLADREQPRPAVRFRQLSRPRLSLVSHWLAAGHPIVSPEGNLSRRYLIAKRLLDVAGALVLLAVLSPIILTVLVILLFTTRGKPVFRQVRLGYLGRPFTMYKFRTMALNAEGRRHEVSNEKDGPIFKNRRDPRITLVGRYLRKFSIDEMPQLINVLKGDMSLVGPRPPIMEEVARYEPWQRRRLAVMPGLTCLWQVSGRSEIGFAQWVRMDLWYVKHQSFLTDLKLLLQTPWCVVTGRGAY